ncbi:MAG TPA: response regulator transcription factor [Anaerolineae bacterium]|nr:response regulator transcription factor [Anaerolineae bacterium]
MLQGARILIVDDERTTRLSLSEIFSLRGANTSTAADGAEALAQIKQTAFDLIILDVKMPGVSGLQVLEYVQENAPGTVCVLLTAHATIDSAIRALRQGAFDYVLKPAQPKAIIEVAERGLAKRQEFLRRKNLVDLMEQTVEAFKAGSPTPQVPPPQVSTTTTSSPQLSAGNITADLHRREAKLDDRLLDLTPTEFDTLVYFIRNAERVVSCRDLVKAVHGYDTTENAARPIMRVHIHRLRQKIEVNAASPERLLTIRSAGYMLTSRPRPQ